MTGLQPLIDYYRDVGPSAMFRTALLSPHDPFGVEGYLVMLVGQRVPYRRTCHPTAAELARWAEVRRGFGAAADRGVPVAEAVARLRDPSFGWHRGTFDTTAVNPAAVATAAV